MNLVIVRLSRRTNLLLSLNIIIEKKLFKLCDTEYSASYNLQLKYLIKRINEKLKLYQIFGKINAYINSIGYQS